MSTVQPTEHREGGPYFASTEYILQTPEAEKGNLWEHSLKQTSPRAILAEGMV